MNDELDAFFELYVLVTRVKANHQKGWWIPSSCGCGVIVTHLESNISFRCGDYRTQPRNLYGALKGLQELLEEKGISLYPEHQ